MSEKTIEKPPEHLNAYGKRVWRACIAHGTVADADYMVLLAYVSACVRLVSAMKTLKKEGDCLYSATGMVRKHPAVDMEAQARKDIGALSTKLRLNPESRLGRSKIDTEPSDKKGILT